MAAQPRRRPGIIRMKIQSRLGNKKFRSASKPLYGISVDPNKNNGLKSTWRLLYKSQYKNKYPLMDTSTSIPIVGWKTMKKQLDIISKILIPGCLPHCGFCHRFELNDDLPSMSDKDKQLLYSLIKRLLFICEITIPEVHACVSYITTRIESPTLCHKKGHLKVEVLSMKKLRLFLLSSTEEHCVPFRPDEDSTANRAYDRPVRNLKQCKLF